MGGFPREVGGGGERGGSLDGGLAGAAAGAGRAVGAGTAAGAAAAALGMWLRRLVCREGGARRLALRGTRLEVSRRGGGYCMR